MLSAVRQVAIAIADRLLSMPAPAVIIHSVQRMMAREVMLFAGGASFFALLALVPALAAGAAIYGLLVSADAATAQMTRIADTGVMPPGAQTFLANQVSQLAGAPAASLTLQGGVALIISIFAAARGAKAIIAGLNQIARRGDLRNVLHFNLIAMGAVMMGGLLLVASNVLVFAVPNIIRPVARLFGADGLDYSLVFNEWTTSALAMGTALYLLYRYLMQRAGETSRTGSAIGAACATGLWLAGSKGFSLYVTAVIHPSAYGSLGALIVFLLWVYWSSYAVFFGGSIAVEVDNWRAGKRMVDVDRGADLVGETADLEDAGKRDGARKSDAA